MAYFFFKVKTSLDLSEKLSELDFPGGKCQYTRRVLLQEQFARLVHTGEHPVHSVTPNLKILLCMF